MPGAARGTIEADMQESAPDKGWREATRAMEHRPHRPAQMLSLESNGPIKDWVCPRCSDTMYSIISIAPVCEGGYGRGY